jgi:hypothetical protein
MSLYAFYNPVGSPTIQEVHGRYFIVIFQLLLLGLFGLDFKSFKLSRFLLVRVIYGITLLAMMLYSTGMYVAYYVRCGTSFFRSGLCYQPVYKNWSPNSVYFPPISSSYSLTQWFIPKCNYLSSIRMWVDSTGSDPKAKTEFILSDEQNDTIVVEDTRLNGDLPKKGWFTLTFARDETSGGKWFTLTIQPTQDTDTQGVRVASSIKAEYIDAPLLENGSELENDLIFQYGCIAGWDKLFLNAITLLNKH